MAALTRDKATSSRAATGSADPVAAGVKIYRGAMVALDAAGDAVPGGTAGAIVTRGVAVSHDADNTNGIAGDRTIQTRNGEAFLFGNSTGADAIDRTGIGQPVYAVDDQTVAATDDSGARIVAGTCIEVADGGVWVKI